MLFNFSRLSCRGYNFGKIRGADYADGIVHLPLPDKIIIPLNQGFSVETQSLVKKGDPVRAGQIIGRDDHTWSSPVHASVNGVVEGFESFFEKNESFYGVVIRRDHEDDRGYVPIKGAGAGEKSREEISEILYLAGVTALGSTGIPSFHHTSDIDLADVKALVINGLCAEPFSLPQDKLLRGRGEAFRVGLDLLMHLLALEGNVHIVLPKGTDISEETEAFKNERVKVHFFENRYPFDMDAIATELATGKRVPDGGTPSEVGVVHVTFQDVFHVYEAIVLGKPVIDRFIALGGPGVNRSRLFRVAVGTPVEWLLLGNIPDGIEARILVGGAMRGTPLESASHPVDRTVSSLTVLEENREREFLYFLRPGASVISYSREYISSFFKGAGRNAETNIQGERRTCIFCSYCEDICPRRLVPHLYSRYVNHEMAEDAVKYGMEACIECGLCTFVCPSKIELMEHIIEGKKALEEKGRWTHPAGLRKLEAEGKI